MIKIIAKDINDSCSCQGGCKYQTSISGNSQPSDCLQYLKYDIVICKNLLSFWSYIIWLKLKEFCKLQYQISNIVNNHYHDFDWLAGAGNMCLVFASPHDPLTIQTVNEARLPSRRGSNYLWHCAILSIESPIGNNWPLLYALCLMSVCNYLAIIAIIAKMNSIALTIFVHL